ncbi:glycosyltransferase family 2 protein [Desulfohalovibrio reitneri]|uniref:glycosyltransferase family 2 protein n=1 Tax=Desulfohalovibrio reitneri TaxID=1307759 RepID=UPI0005569602|nr:glycosyltransferase family 2 protein [Desulfohalovibrio reitneri]
MTALLLAIPLAGLTLAVAYLWLMALAGLRRPSARVEAAGESLRFAVVVPAHDEEETIAPTLASLHAMDYPADSFQVVVLADNCTDDTAGTARRAGARCIERTAPDRRGKGQALRHAFDILLGEDVQAVAVVDADTVVEPDFLRAADARLRAGERVVQARYGVENPDDTALTYMLAVGNAIENDLFLRGRERLGLPSILRGNGMAFGAELLREHPWEAGSVVEDTEYSLDLLLAGVPTRFAGETEVRAPLPRTLEQAASQRVRWASGNSGVARRKARDLLAEGLRRGRPELLDTAFCLAIRSKPLLLLASFLLAGASLLAGEHAPWAVTLAGLLAAYMALGMVVMGLTPARLRLALAAPFSLAWLTAVSLLGLTGFRGGQWTRTGRA